MNGYVLGSSIVAVALCSFALGGAAPATQNRDTTEEAAAQANTQRLGEFTFVLGEDMSSVIENFRSRYRVTEEEPDYTRPELTFFTIRNAGVEGEILGYLIFREKKLASVTHPIGKYENADAESVVSDLIGSLEEMSAQTDEPIRVHWDDGIISGQKTLNSRLRFSSGERTLDLVIHDSPGASDMVTLASRVGNERKLSDE